MAALHHWLTASVGRKESLPGLLRLAAALIIIVALTGYFADVFSLLVLLAALLLVASSYSLEAVLRQLAQENASRQQAEASLHTQREAVRQFQEALKAFQDVSLELAREDNLDDLYRCAIELGLESLGFDRMGLFLLDEENSLMIGTFGTDTHGKLRDERYLCLQVNLDDLWAMESFNNNRRVSVRTDTDLYDGSDIVGKGWNALAGLWTGEKVIGWLASDNLLNHKPLQDYQLEILSLYGSLLGHLVTQKQAEQDLHENQEQLRLALQAAQMRTWRWDILTDKIIRHDNGAWMPSGSTFGEFLAHIHPEDQEGVRQAAQRALAGTETYRAEYRYNIEPLGWRSFYGVGQVFRNPQGAAVSMVGVTQDITERKQSENELRLSEERFNKAFRANPSAIAITTDGANERYIDVNDSWVRLMGYSAEETIGKLVLDLDTWADVEQYRQIDAQFERDGFLHFAEVTRRTKSGKTVYMVISCEKIEIASQFYLLNMLEDITERKIAERQALELNLEKERVALLRDFISNISHDFKTPLTVIGNSLYLMERLEDPQKQKDNLALIKTETQLLNKYIQDILTISRLDHAPRMSFKPVDLNHLLSIIQIRLQSSVEKKGISITWKLSDDIPPVLGDTVELNRVLVNLVENALEFTPENGSMSVSIEQREQGVVLEVNDSGIAMDNEDIAHIFDRYYRSDHARSTAHTGIGLGLAIAKRIVDIHNGRIEAESREGQGSIFRVWLPLTQEAVP